MGLFNSFRDARLKAKKQIKAAEARARQEVKEQRKLELKRDKLLAKQENRLLKEEKKGLKRKRKHEHKMAKQTLQQIREGRFNRKTVSRYSGVARAVAPLAIPLVYRGIVLLRDQVNNRRAAKFGVSPEQLGQFAGHGAELKARIVAMRKLVKSSHLPSGFVSDVEDRLDDLFAGVENAEYMTPELRTRSHRAITQDLDQVAKQIQDRISRP